MTGAWINYLCGIALTIMAKLIYWMYGERPENVKFWVSMKNFFFGDKNAFITSIAQVGLFWVIGSIYIDRFDLIYMHWLTTIPAHKGFALMLGSLAELGGTAIIKILVDLFTGVFNKFFQ